MALHYEWIVEGRVAYVWPEGTLAPHELADFNNRVQVAMNHNAGDGPLHFVLDLNGVDDGTGLRSVGAIADVAGHPRHGWTLVLDPPAGLRRMMAATADHAEAIRARPVDRMADAAAELNRVDADLPDMEPVLAAFSPSKP